MAPKIDAGGLLGRPGASKRAAEAPRGTQKRAKRRQETPKSEKTAPPTRKRTQFINLSRRWNGKRVRVKWSVPCCATVRGALLSFCVALGCAMLRCLSSVLCFPVVFCAVLSVVSPCAVSGGSCGTFPPPSEAERRRTAEQMAHEKRRAREANMSETCARKPGEISSRTRRMIRKWLPILSNMSPKLLPGGLWVASGAQGVSEGASRSPLGVLLGPFWVALGASWGRLGPSRWSRRVP